MSGQSTAVVLTRAGRLAFVPTTWLETAEGAEALRIWRDEAYPEEAPHVVAPILRDASGRPFPSSEALVNHMQRAAAERAILLTALKSLVAAVDSLDEENGDRNLFVSHGCLSCTAGTTPDRYNTGPCAYHAATAAIYRVEHP